MSMGGVDHTWDTVTRVTRPGKISMPCHLCHAGKFDLIFRCFERGDLVTLSDIEALQHRYEFRHAEAKENAWGEQFAFPCIVQL